MVLYHTFSPVSFETGTFELSLRGRPLIKWWDIHYEWSTAEPYVWLSQKDMVNNGHGHGHRIIQAGYLGHQ